MNSFWRVHGGRYLPSTLYRVEVVGATFNQL